MADSNAKLQKEDAPWAFNTDNFIKTKQGLNEEFKKEKDVGGESSSDHHNPQDKP